MGGGMVKGMGKALPAQPYLFTAEPAGWSVVILCWVIAVVPRVDAPVAPARKLKPTAACAGIDGVSHACD